MWSQKKQLNVPNNFDVCVCGYHRKLRVYVPVRLNTSFENEINLSSIYSKFATQEQQGHYCSGADGLRIHTRKKKRADRETSGKIRKYLLM